MQQPKRATLAVRPPPATADMFVAQGDRRSSSASGFASSDVVEKHGEGSQLFSALPLDSRSQVLSVERQTSDIERLSVLKTVEAESQPTKQSKRSHDASRRASDARGQASEQEVPVFRRASKAMLGRKSSDPVRRTTVYFQITTAAGLAEHCSRHDLEMSAVVDRAVREFLERNRQGRA